MTISSKFKVTSMQVAGGNAKVSLNIPIEDIDSRTLAELTKLPGNYMTVSFMPESIEITSMIDESGNPTVAYVQEDGKWVAHKQEQTNLIGDEKLKEVTSFVPIADIDEFISTASYLEYESDINPKELIDCLAQGMAAEEIANEQECSAAKVEVELSKARKHFAPYAQAWKKAQVSD